MKIDCSRFELLPNFVANIMATDTDQIVAKYGVGWEIVHVLGYPMGTPRFSSKQLLALGFVGLYMRPK